MADLLGEGVEEDEKSLWTVDQLKKYCNLKGRETIGKMARSGRLTIADGLVWVGNRMRFDSRVVKARIKLGWFGRGFDENGRPVKRIGDINIEGNGTSNGNGSNGAPDE